MTQAFEHIFDTFVQQYIDHSNAENRGLLTEYDVEWPSPCLPEALDHKSNGENCNWLPVKRTPQADLMDLASALEIHIPAEFGAMFGRYFSLDLHAQHARGPVILLQTWNEQDYERLQKNLIAHVLMKRRLKQPDTLFFALTDHDDLVISLDVATQAVVLEPVGKEPKEVLSDSLSQFIAALSPSPQFVSL